MSDPTFSQRAMCLNPSLPDSGYVTGQLSISFTFFHTQVQLKNRAVWDSIVSLNFPFRRKKLFGLLLLFEHWQSHRSISLRPLNFRV